MSALELLEMIDKLPLEKQKEVEEFVADLLSKDQQAQPAVGGKPKMRFGDLKGVIAHISDDFDEPLEEFKDYM